jgi:N-acetylglucosamine malate deacetylase 1
MKKNKELILVVAAHPDDEVLGCGASIAKWVDAGNEVHVLIMSDGETARDLNRGCNFSNEKVILRSELAYKAGDVLGVKSIKLLNLPDNRMDSIDLLDIVQLVEREVDYLKPDMVVTHHGGDLNIDHQITYKAVVTACRPQPGKSVKKLLSFEVPSSTEWQVCTPFQPNWFEDVHETFERKIEALNIYNIEMREWPHARSLRNIEYLAHYRGSSVGCETAEAFILLRNIT